MREIDFLDAVGRVDPWYIDECITCKPPKKPLLILRRAAGTAACLLLVFAAVLFARLMTRPVIIDENGFYIQDGVLLRYTGTETDITVPDSVEAIADFSFLENANRQKIEIIRLGTNVQTVEANAFAGLENLVDLIIAENNLSFVRKDGLLLTSDGSILLRYERQGETSFRVPDSVRFVAAHAVQGTELETIDFGDSLEYIGYYAFAGNGNLAAIHLPDSVRAIGEGAFEGCVSAVDGSVPENALIGASAFAYVPFYHSRLAGRMCPGEEIVRGLVTPSEAVQKSDTGALTDQLEYVLALLRGDEDFIPTEAALFAGGAAANIPALPPDIVLPREVSFEELSFADNGWGSTGIYDLQIFLPVDGHTLVFEAYGYSLFSELYWEDCRFRVVKVYYLQDPEQLPPEDTASAFGWTAVFTKKGELYEGITFHHEDGRMIRAFLPLTASRPYVLIFSPDGSRAAVEYELDGQTGFYIQSLNGDPLMEPNYDYNEYMGRYWGHYKPGTLVWIGNDTVEGENEFGRFRWNIREFEITQLDEDPSLSDPQNTQKKAVTHELEWYTAHLEVPETWRDQTIYRDLVRRGQGLVDSRMQLCDVKGSVPRYVMDGIRAGEVIANPHGVQYRTFFEETPQMTLLEGTLHCVLSCDRNEVLYLYINIYRDDPENYHETVIQPLLDSIRLERRITGFTVERNSLAAWMTAQSDSGTLPPYPYTLEITGFDVPVSIRMHEYNRPRSITAFHQTLPLSDNFRLHTSFGIRLFEAGGAVLLCAENAGLGYNYLLGDSFSQVIEPGYRNSLTFHEDGDGGLRFRRSNNYSSWFESMGALTAALGYDDFLYESGPASVSGSRLMLGEPDESRTVGEVYDLEAEFTEKGYDKECESIDVIFRRNRDLPGFMQDYRYFHQLLTMDTAGLRLLYGDLRTEYSEHGSGQPVCSLEYFPGVLAVFHGHPMEEPLPDDRIPDELILTADWEKGFFGARVGSRVEHLMQADPLYGSWESVSLSAMDGTVTLSLKLELGFILTLKVLDGEWNLPAASASEEEIRQWEEIFKKNPTGEILEIRLSLTPAE